MALLKPLRAWSDLNHFKDLFKGLGPSELQLQIVFAGSWLSWSCLPMPGPCYLAWHVQKPCASCSTRSAHLWRVRGSQVGPFGTNWEQHLCCQQHLLTLACTSGGQTSIPGPTNDDQGRSLLVKFKTVQMQHNNLCVFVFSDVVFP